ncbi:transcriptional regulator [Acinetobacter indicus]|uniref:helix-turn-helix domain-containing protein n=1 Tax=Acinetobacter indicus TaxID=756892 RepID=UPI0005F85C17|nr:helix-turn-helix transcriptional regulator [Acinetobacter indicus]AVH13225.1 XRE family transcriptional regulator [Acinetobacter indicus]KJV45501.1 DNA-binding protein [Acinetobacter indicus]OUY10802.1 transcriptional regulator [Acinetobacter indicus]
MSSIHDPRYKKLIQELISIRESKKVTQVELATSLNKPQSYVAKVENLDRRLDILELTDWLTALDISIIQFIEKTFTEGA